MLAPHPFANRVRARPDVEVIHVSPANRDRLPAELAEGWRGLQAPAPYINLQLSNLAENFGMLLLVSKWVLADGKAIHAPEYLGRVAVPDIDFEAVVRVTCLGEEFLLGRGILDRPRVTFDCGRRLAVKTVFKPVTCAVLTAPFCG
jgi:hypothetical protein